MSDDDYIVALNQAVKQEIVRHYLRERRLVEEEICMLNEEVCAMHGEHSRLAGLLVSFAGALISRRAAREFFKLAGLGLVPIERDDPPLSYPRERGLTRLARFRRLIARLYDKIILADQELDAEVARVTALLHEVNGDVRIFENNYDLLSLESYLRTLDINELQRRKILGVNFTAKEQELSAKALSFRPIPEEALAFEDAVIDPRPAKEVMAEAAPILRRVCSHYPAEVDALFMRY